MLNDYELLIIFFLNSTFSLSLPSSMLKLSQRLGVVLVVESAAVYFISPAEQHRRRVKICT